MYFSNCSPQSDERWWEYRGTNQRILRPTTKWQGSGSNLLIFVSLLGCLINAECFRAILDGRPVPQSWRDQCRHYLCQEHRARKQQKGRTVQTSGSVMQAYAVMSGTVSRWLRNERGQQRVAACAYTHTLCDKNGATTRQACHWIWREMTLQGPRGIRHQCNQQHWETS